VFLFDLSVEKVEEDLYIASRKTMILSRFSGQQVKTKNYLIQIAPVIDNR
jgi:hypothetical protein